VRQLQEALAERRPDDWRRMTLVLKIETASAPVIWATQVLEDLVKTGTPSRGEITDAAMAARAECVMLNKGPYLLEAVDQLRLLFERMSDHQYKKAAKLRRLKSW
jgi:pyruvate kinase